jgi:hypothetical protein
VKAASKESDGTEAEASGTGMTNHPSSMSAQSAGQSPTPGTRAGGPGNAGKDELMSVKLDGVRQQVRQLEEGFGCWAADIGEMQNGIDT